MFQIVDENELLRLVQSVSLPEELVGFKRFVTVTARCKSLRKEDRRREGFGASRPTIHGLFIDSRCIHSGLRVFHQPSQAFCSSQPRDHSPSWNVTVREWPQNSCGGLDMCCDPCNRRVIG
jgi:hypothetical protein